MRHELGTLKEAGFTGYLVKPVRAASLAARFSTDDVFDIRRQPTEPAETPSERPAASTGLSILVAEDNEINALLARALLVKLGHRPTMVGTRQRRNRLLACRARRRNAVRPRADGLAHARAWTGSKPPATSAKSRPRKISRRRRSSRSPPIASAEDREACLAAGMDGFTRQTARPRTARRRAQHGSRRSRRGLSQLTAAATPLPRRGGFRPS